MLRSWTEPQPRPDHAGIARDDVRLNVWPTLAGHHAGCPDRCWSKRNGVEKTSSDFTVASSAGCEVNQHFLRPGAYRLDHLDLAAEL